MKTIVYFFGAVLLVFAGWRPVSAAESDPFEQLDLMTGDLRSGLSVARSSSKGTQRNDEYLAMLTTFQKLSEMVQRRVEHLGLGDDLMFDQYAYLMMEGFKHDAFRRVSHKNAIKVAKNMGPWHVLNMVRRDISSLKTISFSAQGTGSYDEAFQPYLPVLKFQRLYGYYRAAFNSFPENLSNVGWRFFFERRLQNMQQTVKAVVPMLREKAPEFARTANLENDVRTLVNYYYAVRPKDLFSKTTEIERTFIAPSPSPAENKKDLEYAFIRLDKAMSILLGDPRKQRARKREAAAFGRAPDPVPAAAKAEPPAVPEVVAPPVEEKAVPEEKVVPEKPLERLKPAELAERLETVRRECFPREDETELAADRLSRCLDTLTPVQREKYDSLYQSRTRRGETEKSAQVKALRELQPLLNTPNLAPKHKESVEILKRASGSK